MKTLFNLSVIALLLLPNIVFGGGDFQICTANKDQEYPRVVLGSSNYLVTWIDHRAGDGIGYAKIYGQLVSQSGGLVGNEFIIGDSINQQWHSCDIAYGNNKYLVVWAKGPFVTVNTRAVGQLINTNGTLSGSAFLIFEGATEAVVASDGTNFLAVSGNCGQRISSTGSLMGDTISLPGINDQCDMVYDGSNYLIVYRSYNSSNDIYGQRVSSGGLLVGNQISICINSFSQDYPRVAKGSANCMVVWWDNRGSHEAAYGQLISSSGSLIGNNFRISNSNLSYDIFLPVVAEYGANYIVAWYYFCGYVYGQKITSGGVLQDTNYLITNNGGAYLQISGNSTNNLMAWDTDFGTGTDNDIYGTVDLSFHGIEEKASLYKPEIQILPNPLRNSTTIGYSISENTNVSISIYDISGKLIKVLLDKNVEPGNYTMRWDVNNGLDRKLSSGIYFIKFVAGNYKTTKKLTLIK
ncbi:MAG: T9SS type A sorting domain-containing protein [bacterium]